MNNDRRKALSAIIAQIEALEAILEYLTDEEREALENLPVSMAEGERGARMDEAISAMESAAVSLEEARNQISGAVEA